MLNYCINFLPNPIGKVGRRRNSYSSLEEAILIAGRSNTNRWKKQQPSPEEVKHLVGRSKCPRRGKKRALTGRNKSLSFKPHRKKQY
jgi:hypothetical protein